MTREDIRAAIVNIIKDIAPDEDLSLLKGDVRLREQMDLDSMDFLDIVMELRKRYNIEVPEADYTKLATLDSSVDFLEPMLKNK